MNRRQFINTTTALSAGLLCGGAYGASDPKPKTSEARMKIGLYSITYLGIWYKGQPLTLPEVVKTAKKFGYEGIEIDGKRPHGNPIDWPTKNCRELCTMASGEGIEIFGVAANNDFSSPSPEVREAQLCYMRDLIRMTADMGAKNLRVFLAWWGITKHPQIAKYDIMKELWPVVHQKFSEEEIWGWCRDCMIESARYAREAGVTLALQNHPPVIKDYNDVLRMVKEVNSPNLKVCLDAPLMLDKSAVAIQKAAQAVGPLQVMTHFGGEYQRQPDGSLRGIDRWSGVITGETNQYYKDFARSMREIGFNGSITYELCHDLPQINGKPADIEFAHENAKMAVEFMRNIIKTA